MAGVLTLARAAGRGVVAGAVGVAVRPVFRSALCASAVAMRHESQGIKKMFCYQCEQTPGGCTRKGMCGKSATTAAAQDLLIHVLKGVAQTADAAVAKGVSDAKVPEFVTEALFSTLTNVNFSTARIQEYIAQGRELKEQLGSAIEAAGGEKPKVEDPINWENPLPDAWKVGIKARRKKEGDVVAGLQELIVYGLKGVAAYAEHAAHMGARDPAIDRFFYEALSFLTKPDASKPENLLGMALRVGEINLKTMALLDATHVNRFGMPTPTMVRTKPVAGKCILISGHDLVDLENLLKATEGKGINVYTHGEMLPAHGYPNLRKHAHLAGNYGGAWQRQKDEFEAFPGPILMTTNCMLEPRKSYIDRVFTVSAVGADGVKRLPSREDMTPLVEMALQMDGFPETVEGGHKFLTGCSHGAVLGMADKVLAAIKAGDIKKVFLIGGCDGSSVSLDTRNYYTTLAESLPNDAIILSLGCAKYRVNHRDYGTAGQSGIPRYLDVGQCNDSYGAVQIAVGLAKALGCGVNDLPLHFAVSWFEQKAVAVLLTLLHLGIRNIHLGPQLPAFLEPPALQILAEKFALKPIGEDPKKDFNL